MINATVKVRIKGEVVRVLVTDYLGSTYYGGVIKNTGEDIHFAERDILKGELYEDPNPLKPNTLPTPKVDLCFVCGATRRDCGC